MRSYKTKVEGKELVVFTVSSPALGFGDSSNLTSACDVFSEMELMMNKQV
jgi:hypothetical protein